MSNLDILLEELVAPIILGEAFSPIDAKSIDGDFTKSLNTIIKYNKGKFKSERQAEFLYHKLLHSRNKSVEFLPQVKKMIDNEEEFAVVGIGTVPSYGYSAPEYFGRIYIIDSGGVKAAWKIDADMPNDIILGLGRRSFTRKGDKKSLFSTAEKRTGMHPEDKALLDRIEKSLGGFGPYQKGRNFLDSIRQQAKSGKRLSKKQVDIANEILDRASRTTGYSGGGYSSGYEGDTRSSGSNLMTPPKGSTGQLFEPCEKCGRDPVYMPLHLCSRCWPKR